jgi:hypothetical protein
MTAVHEHTQLLAMKAAHDAGRDDLTLGMLDGWVRAYTRSSRSKPGWQISDWDSPVPAATSLAVYVDTTGTEPAFYVIPARALNEIMCGKRRPGPRPVTPDSRHCVLTVDDLAPYRDGWTNNLQLDAAY